MRISVQPTENETISIAKRTAAEQAQALARDPNQAGSVVELRRVVTDILARLEWLEIQVNKLKVR